MANSAGLTYAFKKDLLLGEHNFGTTSATRGSTAADTFKFALYQTSTGNIGPDDDIYTASGEVTATGDYVAGGKTAGTFTAPTYGATTVGYTTPSASVQWTGVTFITDCALLYNSTRSNKTVGSYTFTSQNVSGGNFTLTMPSNTSTTALIQIA